MPIEANKPLKLLPNRVWRTYEGGAMLDRWAKNDSGEDAQYPEEWIASVVRARNPDSDRRPGEGLSRVASDNAVKWLKDLIQADPVGMLGADHVRTFGDHPGILVKLLDSAERLTIQTHPDRRTARALFGSPYGKTEAWYVVATRRVDGVNPYVLFGFKPGVTRERWESMFHRQDIAGMVQALHKMEITPGQVILVEAGIPHAIGPGCFLVEIQEPTDITIRVERTTPKGLQLDDQSCHQGLGFEKMFDCFRYESLEASEIRRKYFISSEKESLEEGGYRKLLLGYDRCPYFSMEEIGIAGGSYKLPRQSSYSVVIVLEGTGILRWNGGEQKLDQGQLFFLPAGVEALSFTDAGAGLRLVRCLPPIA